MSAKLKAAIEPKECVFSIGDKKYFADPRWKEATQLASESKFAECQRVVAAIDNSYGKIY